MAPDIEAESAIFDGSRKPAHIAGISFKNINLIAVAGEFIACRQTGRPGSDNHAPMIVDIRQITLPREGLWYTRIESRVKKKLQGR